MTSRSSDSGALTPDQMKVLQILQREDPADEEKVERFLKGSMDYKLGLIYKGILRNERLNGRFMQDSKVSRKEGDLRAAARPIIRRRLILGRYEDALWSNAEKVFAHVKPDLDDEFDELAGAARVVGKVRIEEKAKLKDRLLRARDRP